MATINLTKCCHTDNTIKQIVFLKSSKEKRADKIVISLHFEILQTQNKIYWQKIQQ